MSNQNSRPLEGIRVLDLTVALAGPYASMVLGGMGAEVIRVEGAGRRRYRAYQSTVRRHGRHQFRARRRTMKSRSPS